MALNAFPVCDYQEVKAVGAPDPTSKMALRALNLREKMKMVEDTASLFDICDYLFEAVTTGKTYTYFEANGAPFGRDLFYDRLRRFYYELDKVRM